MEHKIIENKDVWESSILNAGFPTSFFQSWDWGEFEKSLGKKVMRYGFFRDERLVGVAQIIEIKAKRGNFLHVRNGPVFDWDNHSLRQEMVSKIIQIAKLKGVDFVRISPLIEASPNNLKFLKELGLVKNQTHDVDAEITWVLDITKSQEDILLNMRKNTRYYINKAQKDGVEVEITTEENALKDFYKIYIDTVKRQKWKAYSYEYISEEFRQFKKDNKVKLFNAKYKGKTIASSIFIYYGDEVYYHHSGSLTEFRKIPASYLIQWESIKEAKKLGYKTYNFFGIAREDNPKHPWYGLTFFKKGFGGYERRSVHGHDLPIKSKYWLTYFYEFLERKRRGY